MHVRAARRNGLTHEEIREVLLHTAVYAGVPAANAAFAIAQRVLEEECLHDGGDRLAPAGFDSQGQLAGVDPEYTVAEYRDSCGRRSIACSNRVCLCVPRFAALRKELPLALQGAARAGLAVTAEVVMPLLKVLV